MTRTHVFRTRPFPAGAVSGGVVEKNEPFNLVDVGALGAQTEMLKAQYGSHFDRAGLEVASLLKGESCQRDLAGLHNTTKLVLAPQMRGYNT